MNIESLQERLDFLREGGQVSAQAEKMTIEIITEIEKKFNIEFSEEYGGMFITHMLLFFERTITGAEMNYECPMEHKEIKACEEEYNYMKSWMDKLGQEYNREFPEAETSFLTAHLLCLLGKI